MCLHGSCIDGYDYGFVGCREARREFGPDFTREANQGQWLDDVEQQQLLNVITLWLRATRGRFGSWIRLCADRRPTDQSRVTCVDAPANPRRGLECVARQAEARVRIPIEFGGDRRNLQNYRYTILPGCRLPLAPRKCRPLREHSLGLPGPRSQRRLRLVLARAPECLRTLPHLVPGDPRFRAIALIGTLFRKWSPRIFITVSDASVPFPRRTAQCLMRVQNPQCADRSNRNRKGPPTGSIGSLPPGRKEERWKCVRGEEVFHAKGHRSPPFRVQSHVNAQHIDIHG